MNEEENEQPLSERLRTGEGVNGLRIIPNLELSEEERKLATGEQYETKPGDLRLYKGGKRIEDYVLVRGGNNLQPLSLFDTKIVREQESEVPGLKKYQLLYDPPTDKKDNLKCKTIYCGEIDFEKIATDEEYAKAVRKMLREYDLGNQAMASKEFLNREIYAGQIEIGKNGEYRVNTEIEMIRAIQSAQSQKIALEAIIPDPREYKIAKEIARAERVIYDTLISLQPKQRDKVIRFVELFKKKEGIDVARKELIKNEDKLDYKERE